MVAEAAASKHPKTAAVIATIENILSCVLLGGRQVRRRAAAGRCAALFFRYLFHQFDFDKSLRRRYIEQVEVLTSI
jgi:hypothetical protein